MAEVIKSIDFSSQSIKHFAPILVQIRYLITKYVFQQFAVSVAGLVFCMKHALGSNCNIISQILGFCDRHFTEAKC
jgi:hypothetical protein